VHDRDCSVEVALQLQETAWVRSRDDVDTSSGHCGRLSLAELGGGAWLDEVVDTGRTAAHAGLGELDQLEAGDRREDPPRLVPHALRVGEVAGVVVGDAEGDRPPLGVPPW
jgi:hypothetical protein